MLPRIWTKQLFFIPVAFFTVWFIFSFLTFLHPTNFFKEDAPTGERIQIIDNIEIRRTNSYTSTKVPYAISNADHIKELIVNRKAQKKISKSTTSTPTEAVQNLTQSAINRSISDIKKIINQVNSEQKVLSDEKFKPEDNDMVVIVVQVHNRVTYLEYLIDSLRTSYGIANALLIFSHDFFDEDIHSLIATIDFCRVMQIYYPLSLQLVPNKFPGSDPKDCHPDMPKAQALAISCQNAQHPDSYGHYRNAKIVQLKHHWWWKANTVFSLQAVRGYKGPVIFLEEDLYIVEDFIPTMKLMLETANVQCKNCKILSLATNQDAVFANRADFSKSAGATVTSQFSNMGLAFTAQTWKEMQECAHIFCQFDDYNWDVSMQHIFTTCMKDTAAMTLNAPRVFHLGSCGTHHTSQNCDSAHKIREINDITKKYHRFLYPKTLNLRFDIDNRRSDVFYGGWGDPRDQELCVKHVRRI